MPQLMMTIISPPEKCFVAQPALVILVLSIAKWTNIVVDTLNHGLQLTDMVFVGKPLCCTCMHNQEIIKGKQKTV